MSFNGSGTFQINSVGNPVVTGTVISSTWANALTADLATGLSTCITKDGQTTTTAAIPFGAGLTTPTGQGFNPGAGGTLIGYFVKRATVDQSITTNTTLASATNMSFAIAASEEWVAEFYLDIGQDLATTGIKLAVTTPTSATQNIAIGMTPGQVDASGVMFKRTTTSGTALDWTTAQLVAGNTGLFCVSIWVLNSTNAGTVQLQIAQSTSSATALILRKGSHMLANRVA